MTRSDEVFALFVEANPVSATEQETPPVPDVDEVLYRLKLSSSRQSLVPSPSSVRRRWLAAAAAFMVVIVVVGLSVALLDGGSPAPPVTQPSTTTATTTSEPATTTSAVASTIDSLAAVAVDAEAAAEDFLAAVTAGDIDTVMALSTPDAAAISDRRVHEFVAAFSSAGMPMVVADCAAEPTGESSALVLCDVRLGDAVAVELGTAALVYPFRYEAGLLAWRPFEGSDIAEVNRAYADYLRAYLPDAYGEVCSPSAYDPLQIVQSNLLALTGECGEVAASVADDVAAWIRSGRPDPEG